MKVSYLVTCSTENIQDLWTRIYSCLGDDELVVLQDQSVVEDKKTSKYLLQHTTKTVEVRDGITYMGGYVNVKVVEHPLNNDFGSHKNFGIEMCSGDFIFQIDGDELPPYALLGENLHALLESNPTIEAYAVPRINDFRGVTPQHAAQWGWKLTESPTYHRPVVNFPDYQFRIFKRDSNRIRFLRRLHEKIEGYSSYVALPADEEYALYHDKTIETQIKTNLRYNQMFSQEENKGHTVFAK
jgi:glycosyltransferase involved in cell wall biosynthesis